QNQSLALQLKPAGAAPRDGTQPGSTDGASTVMLKRLRPLDFDPRLNEAQQRSLAELKAHRVEFMVGIEPAWVRELVYNEIPDGQRRGWQLTVSSLSQAIGTPAPFRMQRVRDFDAAVPHLLSFPRLKHLDIPARALSDEHLKQIAGLSQLRSLKLYGATVSDAGLSHLKELTELRELGLQYTGLTDAGLEHLAGMRQLESLDLLGTAVTDAGLVHLRGVRSLRSLSLCRTGVTDAGLRELNPNPLTDLRELDVSETRVTQAAINELQAAIPECRIKR
ncbi:MAG TPA: hypothetical protein VML55_00985, partial [Planctomycetaceae bacterium]|nr:hypothetical protein [Planctomycetaceae bacterium]